MTITMPLAPDPQSTEYPDHAAPPPPYPWPFFADDGVSVELGTWPPYPKIELPPALTTLRAVCPDMFTSPPVPVPPTEATWTALASPPAPPLPVIVFVPSAHLDKPPAPPFPVVPCATPAPPVHTVIVEVEIEDTSRSFLAYPPPAPG